MKIPTGITSTFGRSALKLKGASPQLLFAVGIVGMGATVVLASRATLRLEETLDKAQSDLAEARFGTVSNSDDIVPAVQRRQLHVYINSGFSVAKLYAPAALCGVVSVAALTQSHRILVSRNAGLTAAYAALDKAYRGYRDRIRQELGEDREREIYNDVQVCEIEDPATGKKSKLPVSLGGAPYAVFFDQHNKMYDVLPETNLFMLRSQQNYFNQKLQATGHVFLNDVYRALGFPDTSAGSVCGWVKGAGDDCVDFGIFNVNYEDRMYDFMRGVEPGIWLDFNVDGPIWDKI